MPNEFNALKQSLNEQRLTYTIQEYASKGSVNRTANSVSLFNEKWIVCVCSPYEQIQGAIDKNARLNIIFSILAVIAVGIVATILFRINKGKAIAEAEAGNLKKIAKAAEALTISEEKYRTIIENIEDGYFEVDLAGKFTFFNESLRKQFGYTKKELIGMNNRDYMEAENAKQVFKKFNHVYKTGKPSYNINWEFIRKDGEKRIAESSISLIHDSQRQPIGFRGIIRDETDRIKAKEALEKSEERYRNLTDKLTISNNMKELLIDVITHDIKNPAGVIKVMSELISGTQQDSEEIQLIRKSSENLLNTIKDATTLAQVTLDREINKEAIDLSKVIQDIVMEFSPRYGVAGLVLENNITEPLIVEANPIIKEVFHNYISNALKYASEGKKVIIERHLSADTVTIEVKDLGITIPEMDRARIFDRKIQLETGEKRGRGLGLSIVKRIADAHNAEVGVKPNEPAGNIFYIEIPI